MAAISGASFLPEQDMLDSILGELKRTVREYTTAATESSCPAVRRMFENLTADTLRLQGEFYNLMKQENMYSAGSYAQKAEVDKQLKQALQSVQKTRELIALKTAATGMSARQPNVGAHAANVPPIS